MDGGGGDCKKAGGCTCNVEKNETHNISGLGTASPKNRDHRSHTRHSSRCAASGCSSKVNRPHNTKNNHY